MTCRNCAIASAWPFVLVLFIAPQNDGSEEAPAKIRIVAPPSSNVIVNGHDYGTTRKLRTTPLTPGKRYSLEFTLRSDEGSEETRKVLVTAGEDLVVRFTKEEPWTGAPTAVAPQRSSPDSTADGQESAADGPSMSDSGFGEPEASQSAATSNFTRPELIPQIGVSSIPSRAAMSRDGSRVAYSGLEGIVVICDVKTGRTLRRLNVGADLGVLEFTPDGEYLMTAPRCGSNNGVHCLWNVRSGEAVRVYQTSEKSAEHGQYGVDRGLGVQAVACGEEGKWFAAMTADGVYTIETHTGRILQRPPPSANTQFSLGAPLTSCVLSSDEQTLLVQTPGTVAQVERLTSRVLRSFGQAPDVVGAHCIGSYDNIFLEAAFAGEDSAAFIVDALSAEIRDLQSGHTILRFTVREDMPLVTGGLSPTGNRAALTYLDGVSHMFDTNTGEKLFEFGEAAKLPPDEATRIRTLLATIRRVRRANGVTQVTPHDLETLANSDFHTPYFLHQTPVVFGPSGDVVLAPSGGLRLAVFDAKTGEERLAFFDRPAMVREVVVSSVEDRVLLASILPPSLDATLRNMMPFLANDWLSRLSVSVIDLQTGTKTCSIRDHASDMLSATLSPDGRTVAIGYLDKHIRLFNADNGERLRDLRTKEPVKQLCFSPDSFKLGLLFDDNTVSMWDLEENNVLFHESLVKPTANSSVHYGGDSHYASFMQLMQAASSGRQLSGEQMAQILRQMGGNKHFDPLTLIGMSSMGFRRSPISTLAFTPDGTRMGVVFTDWNAYERNASSLTAGVFKMSSYRTVVFDAASGKRLLDKPCSVIGAMFSGEGELLTVERRIMINGGSEQYHFLATDLRTGVERTLMEAERMDIFFDAASPGAMGAPAIFCPERDLFAVGCSDKSIGIFDVTARRQVAKLEGHQGAILDVDFMEGGRRLVSTAVDGTVRIWDADSGENLATIINFREQGDWFVATPSGFFDGSFGGRESVAFRFGGGLNVVPVDRFFQEFYYPGLLPAVLADERPTPDAQIGENPPPTIVVLSPRVSGPCDKKVVNTSVEIHDQGGGIKPPWLLHNGHRRLVRGTKECDENGLRWEFEVSLIEGHNELEICSASADGSWESEPARIVLDYTAPLPKPDLYVLAVGVDTYDSETPELRYASSDAQHMVRLFELSGPTLYEKVYTRLLAGKEATRQAIAEAIDTIAGQTRPQDTVVVFLAGHGGMSDEAYYFMPADFDTEGQPVVDALADQGLAATTIGDALVGAPALKRMLIIDTGQSGPVAPTRKTARNPFAFRGAIERLVRAQGGFMIASISTDESAQEEASLGHGFLPYALLAGLHAVESGPLANAWIDTPAENEPVSVLQWYGYADAHVPELAKRLSGGLLNVQHSSRGASFPVLPILAGDADSRSTMEAGSLSRAKTEPAISADVRHASVEGVEGKHELHVIAIGVNESRHDAFGALRFAEADARAIAELFEKRGGSLFSHMHVHQLLGAAATRRAILDELKKVIDATSPDDTLILHLSGHGVALGQRYYYLPYDFKATDRGIGEDVRQAGLAIDALGDAVSKIPARKRLLIFDTCASGAAVDLGNATAGAFSFRGAIDRLGQSQGTFVIAAASADAEAQEHADLGHGLLTYALLEAMGAVAGEEDTSDPIRPARADGAVTVVEWSAYVAKRVSQLMRQLFGQDQTVHTSGRGQAFPVLRSP